MCSILISDVHLVYLNNIYTQGGQSPRCGWRSPSITAGLQITDIVPLEIKAALESRFYETVLY